MITIGDILKDRKFSKLKLINSNVDLTRRVSSIESTETPDVASYLTPNTFLLTTGMSYRGNQDALCDLIIELNELPCAALGIKLGRFIEKLDDKVIETANRLNFPLIQIPLDLTLGKIFHDLLGHLWDNQNEQLLYSLNIQKKFSELILRNATIDIFLRNLSNTLKKSIALIDPFGNIENSTNSNKKKYSKQVLRDIVEHLAEEGKPTGPLELTIKDSRGNSSLVSIYPINMASYYPYYLVIFDAKNMEYPISTIAIEQALIILAFTIYKNLRISHNNMMPREDFFNDLISFKPQDRLNNEHILHLGKKYGFHISNYYQIVMVSISNKEELSKDITIVEEWYTLIFNWLEDKLHKNIPEAILFPDRSNYNYIILLQDSQANLINRLISYRLILQKTLKLDTNFYIGNKVQDINYIKYSYRDAMNSIEFGHTKNDIDFIKYYDQLDTLELMQLLPKNQMEDFVSNTLKTLAYPTDETLLEFKNTLKTYLDLNCNITDTANSLFIHRNTVKYRINRCEEILGRDITDPSYSLQLRLSLAYLDDGQENMPSN